MIALPKDVITIINRIQADGHEAFIVGGCIRDHLLNKPVNDYDITTSASTEQIKKIFAKYKVIPTGEKHGTVTLLYRHRPYEITTFRSDSTYSDHRHPDQVIFTTSITEDLARRDFTVNAMAYNPEKGLVDPFNGYDDLKKGIIRCVGNPDTRFKEDALRIMRCLRFASRLGFRIDEETSQAVDRNKELLEYVSVERLYSEFVKILLADGMEQILTDYRDIFAQIIPETAIMFDYDQCNHHHVYDLWTHTIKTIAGCKKSEIQRLAAYFHDIGKPQTCTCDDKGIHHFHGHPAISSKVAEEVLKRLHCSREVITNTTLLIQTHDIKITSKKTVRKLLGQLGLPLFRELVALKKADNLAQNMDYYRGDRYYRHLLKEAKKIIDDAEALSIKDLAINGNDLKELGYEGEMIGKALHFLLDEVIEGNVENKKDALIRHLISF